MDIIDTLITKSEVKTLRANAKTITLGQALFWGDFSVDPLDLKVSYTEVKPLTLASGYKVSMTMNDVGTGRIIEHISVYNPSGRPTDPADAEIIAKAVLGDGYMVLEGGELLKENKHFIKIKKQEEK